MIYKVYKRKEVAEMLRISEDALDEIVKCGEIDSTMIGRRRMFLEYHIENYQKKNETINYKQ